MSKSIVVQGPSGMGNYDYSDMNIQFDHEDEPCAVAPAIVPTDEQEKVIELSKIHRALKISAYAGAAKTSTLVMVAQQNCVPSLMMTFNKALADEAKARFPSWVECRTVHSMAYAAIGHMYQKKLKRPYGAYKNVASTGTEIAKYFKTGDFQYMHVGAYEANRIKAGGVGVAIKETVARFEQSADDEMEFKHVSFSPCDTAMLRDASVMKNWAYTILRFAKQLWDLRINVRSEVLCTHDTYLKLWQLSNPDLSQYEMLYLDEFQDTNPVVMDIFLKQMDRCRLIAVGDRFQNIYSWRGAVNGMEQLDWPEAKLSKSFRWGQTIGNIADCILSEDGNKITNVKGWENLTTAADSGFDVPEEFKGLPYTMLFRTNGALIMHAVGMLENNPELRLNLEIDVSDFTKKLESAIELFKGNLAKVKHEDLLQFNNWKEYGVEAEIVQGEMLRIFNMVSSGAVYKVLGVLSSHKNYPNPEVTLTTAHKSKGREWDIVLLGYDFPSPINNKGEWVGLIDGERNLLYVAATRAKVFLGINETVEQLIDRCERRSGVSIELGTCKIVAYNPATQCDVEAQIEKQMMEFGSGVITDLDRFMMPDLDRCDTDGFEIFQNELGELKRMDDSIPW